MKKIIFASFLLFLTFTLQAQSVKEAFYAENKSYRFLAFDTEKETFSPNQTEKVFINFLNASQDMTFTLYESTSDEYGYTHDKYQQHYKGVKVEHAVYFIHAKNGIVHYANGDFRPFENLSVLPQLSEKEALLVAMKAIGAEEYAWENPESEALIKELRSDDNATYYPKGELLIRQDYALAAKNDNIVFNLAYKFFIAANKPDLHETVYVNAHTGELIARETEECHIAGDMATRYNGTKNVLSHTTRRTDGKYILRGNGIHTVDLLNKADTDANRASAVDFADNNNEWTAAEYNNARKDNIALSVHWAAAMSKKYWGEVHGRNSYNNLGGEIKSYVHWLDPDKRGAVWTFLPSNEGYIKVGDGDGINFDTFASLDIISHEIGHGVTRSCNVHYNGADYTNMAIHEALSDIWAICVENRYAPNKVWHIGEDITKIFIGTEKAIRVISNPKSSNHADTYEGTNWYAPTTNPFMDTRYVRSTVISHWFYMLSVGKNGINDMGKRYSVQGIGIDKAEKIVYYAIKNASVPIISFQSFMDATVMAAKSIYGNDCSQEVRNVRNAWFAAGVIDSPAAISSPAISGGVSYCNFIISVTSIGATSYSWTIPELGVFNELTTSNTYNVHAGECTGTSALSVTCTAIGFGCSLPVARVFNCPTFPTNPPCNLRMANPGIKAYPNPTDDALTVELVNLDSPLISLKIFNAQGSEVLSAEDAYFDADNRSILSLKHLADGIYFLKIAAEDGRFFSQKIILQKGKIAD